MNVNRDFRACVHCAHFSQPKGQPPQCRAQQAALGLSRVTALPMWRNAHEMRGNAKLCGPDGRYWAAKRRPIADRLLVAQLWGAWYAGRIFAMPARAKHSIVQAWRGFLVAALARLSPAANEPIKVESVQVEGGGESREDQPIQPLPPPEPKPEPEQKPEPRAVEIPSAAALIAGAMVALVLGFSVGQAIPATTIAGRTCCEKGNPTHCWPCPDAPTWPAYTLR